MKTHVYYTFQHRRVAESEWLTEKPIHPIRPKPKWDFSSWDCNFGKFINPLDYKPKSNETYYPYAGGKEPHEVWCVTGSHGYWTLDYAAAALARLIVANSKGEFDTRSGYGQHEQSARYEFRIVKVTHTERNVEVV